MFWQVFLTRFLFIFLVHELIIINTPSSDGVVRGPIKKISNRTLLYVIEDLNMYTTIHFYCSTKTLHFR